MTTTSSRQSARDRLLDTAGRLFYERGFLGVGVDEIVAASGVAKMTLYRHFASKDDLVVAYLRRADDQFSAWAERALATEREPRARIIALFRAVGLLAQSTQCLGCTFQLSASEFPDPAHPAHEIAVAHKRAARKLLADLARQAGLRDPGRLADKLLLLMDGAWVAARMFDRGNPARHVAEAAESLIAAHE